MHWGEGVDTHVGRAFSSDLTSHEEDFTSDSSGGSETPRPNERFCDYEARINFPEGKMLPLFPLPDFQALGRRTELRPYFRLSDLRASSDQTRVKDYRNAESQASTPLMPRSTGRRNIAEAAGRSRFSIMTPHLPRSTKHGFSLHIWMRAHDDNLSPQRGSYCAVDRASHIL